VVEGENDGEHKKVRTIESVIGFRYKDGLVVRMEDGTCSQVVSAVEETGNKKLFIDVWLIINIPVDRMREQKMMARTWMRMGKVKFAQGVGGWVACGLGSFLVHWTNISSAPNIWNHTLLEQFRKDYS
jgi:hypothetical protein